MSLPHFWVSFYCSGEANLVSSALPILRELGAQQGGTSLLRNLRKGETSMLKVWVGLEARKFLQASIESVSDDKMLDSMQICTDQRTG